MKRALITGITGQDGSYLAEHLLAQGYDVWGLVRRTSLDPMLRIEKIAHLPTVHLRYGSLRDGAVLDRVLKECQPDEIYNLAALSDVWISFKCPEETMDINYSGLGRLIIAATRVNPKVRIYQASTSEMFGNTKPPQNEDSPFNPVSPYAESKLRAYEEYVRGYREHDKLFICSGILFNHESPRRGEHFVTRKITICLSKIKLGMLDSFSLGNLESKRDWGYAGDSVKAMHLMLQQKEPRDYVIATGVSHSVRDFVEVACRELDIPIEWKGKGLDEVGIDKKGKVIISIDKKFFRPVEVNALCGDSTRARTDLGWKPEVTFNALISMMAQADFKRLQKTL